MALLAEVTAPGEGRGEMRGERGEALLAAGETLRRPERHWVHLRAFG